MKSRTLKAACLLVLSGTVHAQTSVQVFGTLDLNIGRLTGEGNTNLLRVGTDGNNSSRIGLRGSEDLGGGLSTSFWLEAGMAADTGAGVATSTNNVIAAPSSGLTWNRRSTVSLTGQFGEIRLGRDIVPSFRNLTAYHPFGVNGVGTVTSLFYPVSPKQTTARASNSLAYFLPKGLGGLRGELMVARGENDPSINATRHDGNYAGLRIGYAQGALETALGHGKTTLASGDFTQTNLGGAYTLGPAKLLGLWGENEVGSSRTRSIMIGGTLDVGAGQWRGAYTRLKALGVANNAQEISVGYVHHLSKRTAIYGNYAYLDNKDNGRTFNVGRAVLTSGGGASGLDMGLRHNF